MNLQHEASPKPRPTGLSSGAVVRKMKLREEKTLAGFEPTGHFGIHIQSLVSIASPSPDFGELSRAARLRLLPASSCATFSAEGYGG